MVHFKSTLSRCNPKTVSPSLLFLPFFIANNLTLKVQRIKFLSALMRPWHWFLNRPSFRFTVDPDVAALIQRLRLQATLFPVPNPTRYGRHTHSSFTQTKAAHNDQACHYGQLIWSGPGHGGFISVMPHTHCVSQPQYAVCVLVCVCVRERIRPYTNKFGLESLGYCMSFNCHLHCGRIVTFWILTRCPTHSSRCSLLPITRLCQCQRLPVSPCSATFAFWSSPLLFFFTVCHADTTLRYLEAFYYHYLCFCLSSFAVLTSNQKFKVIRHMFPKPIITHDRTLLFTFTIS